MKDSFRIDPKVEMAVQIGRTVIKPVIKNQPQRYDKTRSAKL